MKKYRVIGVILLGTLFVGCGSSSKSISNELVQTESFNKNETDIIYKYVKQMPNKVQVSIAKIEDGVVHYYGALHKNNSVVTIDNHSRGFVIGSISKLFTSTLLAQLVLDGKINLEDDISQRLPFALHNDIHISYKQLANHTSGLERDGNIPEEKQENYHDDDKLDDSDVERYLKEDLVLKYPQNRWHYSNLGVAILGYMITHIEDKPYETMLQDNIFSTLSMHHSTTIRGENLVPAVVEDTIPPMYNSVGGIVSTVEDLYQFSLATFGDGAEYLLTQKPTFDLSNTDHMGLGWLFADDNVTHLPRFFTHDGQTEGYTASLFLDKKNNDGQIILSNLPASNDEEGDDYLTKLSNALLTEQYKGQF